MGVQWDETRREPGRFGIYRSYEIAQIPMRGERPDLEFLDEKTPILYYGKM